MSEVPFGALSGQYCLLLLMSVSGQFDFPTLTMCTVEAALRKRAGTALNGDLCYSHGCHLSVVLAAHLHTELTPPRGPPSRRGVGLVGSWQETRQAVGPRGGLCYGHGRRSAIPLSGPSGFVLALP